MASNNRDVVSHNGERRILADLAHYMDDGQREEVHGDAMPSETAQEWWDRFAGRYPEDAQHLVEITPAVATFKDVLCDDSKPDGLTIDCAGGVAVVDDGVAAWYAPATEVRAALAAECVSEDGEEAYDRFCRLCPSGLVAEDHDAVPMMARYADAKFDLATEDGREEALSQVFLSDNDRMADAMMWLDAQREGVVLP